MRWLSEQLGQNETYIHQFIRRGSPRDLPFEMKLEVANLLDMDLEELGVADYEVRPKAGAPKSDAEPFEPSPSNLLVRHPKVIYLRMKSNVLENHPLRIREGDILAFDVSDDPWEKLRTESIVWADVHDKKSRAPEPRLLVREFVRPGLLITNRKQDNEIIAVSDDSIYTMKIRGIFRSLIRE